jgi:hypothetical protein
MGDMLLSAYNVYTMNSTQKEVKSLYSICRHTHTHTVLTLNTVFNTLYEILLAVV